MKGKLLLIVVILLLCFGFVAFRYFIVDHQNAVGRLKIISSPITSVFVDNVAVGKTPFENTLKPGEHLVKLIPEGNATDSASWQGKIIIYKNAMTYINQELGTTDITTTGVIFSIEATTKQDKSKGEIQIETNPTGAIVSLDNEEKGVAPLVLENVLRGDHEISIYMPGFFRRNEKVNIEPGYRIKAQFKLAINTSEKTFELPKEDPTKDATKSPTLQKALKVIVKDTPTGFLRVREDASINASESAQVKPGESFDLLDEKNGWYKIKVDGKEGWISASYSEKQ